ncbi:PH domain-containing protein [uncultured Corynebacterium sp.]|uniref:PH domain-containing protein n=1 Tax=uncultured Corynebacterium sp. TaxID=159447 RepID=UPI0025EFA233|nr:PH domain-containing protein [uncultured Corynebacterium sp.]
MTPVSRGYLPARLVSVLPWTLVPLIGCAVAAVAVHPWFWAGAGLLGVLLLWQLWLLPAQARHRRWAETSDELLITRGRLWRTFTVVPYGRIQYVDVTAGPVERLFGVKRLKLHTASSTSDSEVVGLDAATADALRDRLAVAAWERMSGLRPGRGGSASIR